MVARRLRALEGGCAPWVGGWLGGWLGGWTRKCPAFVGGRVP